MTTPASEGARTERSNDFAPTIAGPRRVAYSITEAALALGVSRSSIERALRAGQLPSRKLGGRVLIPCEAIAAYGGDDGNGEAA